jgi:hypothetical protein
MTATRLDFYQGGLPWGNWGDLFILPLRATYVGWDHSPGYGASIGPLLFGLGLLSLVELYPNRVRIQSGLRTVALISLPGLLIWAILGRVTALLLQTRLYFALFPAFAVLAGGGFAILARQKIPGLRLGRVAGALVTLVLALSALESGLHIIQQNSLRYLAAIENRNAYLEHNLGWYAPAVQAVKELPESTQVLLLFEPRSLYCLPGCQPDEVIDRWLADLDRLGDAQVVLADWRESGYTHLLYNQAGVEFLQTQDEHFDYVNWDALDTLLAGLPVTADFGGAYILYELTP